MERDYSDYVKMWQLRRPTKSVRMAGRVYSNNNRFFSQKGITQTIRKGGS